MHAARLSRLISQTINSTRFKPPFLGNAALDSVSDGAVYQAANFSPFNQCSRDPLDCDKSIPDRVSAVLFLRRPTAVARFVTAIVVYSIDHQTWWSFTHVR
jgi:hypothetical protein